MNYAGKLKNANPLDIKEFRDQYDANSKKTLILT